MATDAYAPQKRYVQRQREAGFTSLTVWVPEQKRDEVLEYAAGLRRQHVAEQQKAH